MAKRSDYGTWPLFRDVFEPTRLNSREPVGMTTPYVESLTSYFARLSWSHCLSPGRLFASVVAPLLHKSYLSKMQNRAAWLSRSFRARSSAINGTGQIAADWVALLEQLTGRENLRFLTFLPWAGILSQRNLLRRSRAWCVICINEQHTTGKLLYEPLLWSVKVITQCVIHEVSLKTKCPFCLTELHSLSHGARPGYCDACGQMLGGLLPKYQIARTTSVERQMSRAKMVGELLANSSSRKSFAHSTLPSAIASLIGNIKGENASRFALRVGRNKSTICGWLHGSRMTLPDLLDLSEQFGTTPMKLLSGSAKIEVENGTHQLPGRKPDVIARKRFNRDGALTSLQNVLTSNPPPKSMQYVAKTMRVDKRLLYKHFPDLCKEIAARAATGKSMRTA
jgi:hypothetical protein